MDWSKYKGDYIKWTESGQVVEGVVQAIKEATYQGKDYPELTLGTEDGTRILPASQAGLMRLLAEDPPEVGDRIRVEYKGEGEARPGQSAIKLFVVDVTHRSGDAPTRASDLV
jgi:hypothetical protein